MIAAIAAALKPLAIGYEVVLVNDGSPDRSWEVVEGLCRSHPEVVGVDLRRNFGQDNAILTGLRFARGRAIAIMDDDLQHHPADLPALLAKLDQGLDVVYADFRIKHQAAWKNFGSWFNGKVAEWVLDKPKGIYLSPYKVLRREVAELICRYDGPEPYVDGLLFQVTSRFAQIEVEHHLRYAGKSNYTLVRSIAVWARLATGHSVRPLRLVTWFGLGLGLLGGLLAMVVIAYRLLYPDDFQTAVAGWASLMVTQLLLGGSRMVFLGILGEYVGRMHATLAGKKPQATIRAILSTGATLAVLDPADNRTVPSRGRCALSRSLVYRNPLLYESLMIALYGRHYAARFRVIAELIPAGSRVLELCCGPGILFRRYLKRKRIAYVGLDINTRFIARVCRHSGRGIVWDLHVDRPLPAADTLVMQASLYQFLPDAEPVFRRMLAAARVQLIIAEPIRNLANSRLKGLAAFASRQTDPGLGGRPLRFTEETLEAFFDGLELRPTYRFTIPGGREKVYVFNPHPRPESPVRMRCPAGAD